MHGDEVHANVLFVMHNVDWARRCTEPSEMAARDSVGVVSSQQPRTM
jgi:hypothetical protein